MANAKIKSLPSPFETSLILFGEDALAVSRRTGVTVQSLAVTE